MMPRVSLYFDLCVVTRSLRDSNFHAHPVVNYTLRLPQYQLIFVGDLIISIRLFPVRPWSLSPRVSPAAPRWNSMWTSVYCHKQCTVITHRRDSVRSSPFHSDLLTSHWELSQSSRPLIHLKGVMISNATSIAFVVDQLSPDTVSLSLQDEAHPRLLQQSPVRSIIQSITYHTTLFRKYVRIPLLSLPGLA